MDLLKGNTQVVIGLHVEKVVCFCSIQCLQKNLQNLVFVAFKIVFLTVGYANVFSVQKQRMLLGRRLLHGVDIDIVKNVYSLWQLIGRETTSIAHGKEVDLVLFSSKLKLDSHVLSCKVAQLFGKIVVCDRLFHKIVIAFRVNHEHVH